MAYSLQLWTEQAILEELEQLTQQDKLTIEEWKYVDTALIMAAGNAFTSIVIARYGGDAARIRP
jgi:hypothetical protein